MNPQKKAWKTRKFTQQTGRMRNLCVVCHNPILNRSLKGKAITCDQKCAGKLAWETRLKN